MSATSLQKANFAKSRGGTLCTTKPDSVHLSIAISETAKRVFIKPCIALMQALHLCERDAKYRLSAKRKFTAAEVATLLQTEEGIHFLVVLMDKARPRWWKAVLKMGLLGSIEERRKADTKLLRKVFHADETTATGFTDAFRAQDPDFFGVVLAGYDEASVAGSAGRPVAPKGRGR